MVSKNKILINTLFIINVVFLLAMISSNFAGITNPVTWWPFSITALIFPMLLILALITAIFWLFIKPVYSLVSVAAILFSLPNIMVSLPLNISSGLTELKSPDELRIVTWNVNLMNYSAKDDATAIIENEKIFNTLYDLNADVICLQEFFTAVIPDKTYNFIDSFYNHLGYHYSYFSKDDPKFDGKFYSGTIIFSKYKIVDSARIPFPEPIAGSIIKTGILYKNDTVDIVSTHMQNINFGRDENKGLQDSGIKNKSPGLITKLKYGYSDQVKQVANVQNVIDKSKRATIFAGDLNDVPTSYTYQNIKRNFKDAWLEKGAGFGATFNFITHTIRIDYIFYNAFFKSLQTGRIISDASDHYGIVTDLLLIPKK